MKSVLITGASSGIGRACVKYFAKKGFFVGLYDLDEASLSSLASELPKGQSCFGVCDVRDSAQVKQMIESFSVASSERLDVLVNCAGVLSGGHFQDLSESQISAMLDVNCKGLTLVAHAAFPLLKTSKDSILVNICSASGLYGIPGLAVYSSTKFYVRGLTEALNIEWQSEGIRVTSVMPPFVKTGMLKDVPEKMLKILGVDLVPEDIAREVFIAAHSAKVHKPVSLKIKALSTIGMRLPASWKRVLVKQLTGS